MNARPVRGPRSAAGAPPGRPVRLLMVTQPTDGGTAVCVRQLARHAVQSGLAVAVASPRGELADWVATDGVHWEHVPLLRAPAMGDVPASLRLRELMLRYDVVHLHSSKAGALGRLVVAGLPRRTHRPSVVFTPHGWSWHAAAGPARHLCMAVERALAPVPDVTVAVSDAESREGRRVLGHRPRALRTIPNGVDTTEFRPDGPVAWRDERPLVVVVGRFAPQKGQDLAIAALRQLQCVEARLRLVGIDSSSREAVMSLARESGAADRVEVVGPTDPRPHLRAADVVLVPSRWDGMSLVLLEAMACGAAIVATAVNGSEAVRTAGLTVPPGDHLAIADALDQLLHAPAQRQDLGRRARERAVSDFAVTRSLEEHVELWTALAGNLRRHHGSPAGADQRRPGPQTRRGGP